jgi:hypothetical protein
MHKYLPSKKFSLIILSIIITLGIVYVSNLLIHKTKSPNSNILAVKTEEQNKVQEFMALDTDGDSLKDWEEALWKTDPKKTDTDGDGTSDGEEIKLNRDPVKANTAKTGEKATDLFDEKVIAANKKTDADFKKLSATDQLAHTFFSQYLASKSASGVALSATNKQIILDTAVSNLQIAYSNKYKISDLKIIDAASTTTIKEFVNRLGFISINAEHNEGELIILIKAIDTQNETVLAGLDTNINSYTKLIKDFLLVPVPKDYAQSFLTMINDLQNIKTSIEKIKNIFSDPAGSIAYINIYKTSILNLRNDILNLKKYLSDKGITFEPKESGYLFINII